MFTREEVTFLHSVRLGEFCSARHDFGAFSRVRALRGGWWLMRDMPLARKDWWIRSWMVTHGGLGSDIVVGTERLSEWVLVRGTRLFFCFLRWNIGRIKLGLY